MLALRIASRFLWSNKLQSLFIMLGIAVGVSVQLFVGLLINGLQQDLIDNTVGNSAHITILPAEDTVSIDSWTDIRDTISGLSGMRAISPAADGNAFVVQGEKSYPILLRGIQLDQADQIYQIRSRLYEGQWSEGNNSVIIGRDLAEQLDVRIGEEVNLLTSSGRKPTMTVSGLYDLQVSSLNNTWVFTSLANTQRIFKLEDEITALEIQVEDVFSADSLAAEIETQLDSDTLEVTNWKDQNAQLLSALQGQSSSSLMIQVFVMISVVIAIASILAITVMQKSRQIGILKAMGIKDSTASLVFLIQGFFMGLGGAVLGIALGLGLLWSFTTFAVSDDGSSIVNIYLDYGFISLSAFIAVLAATLAGVVPARRSARLDPIEVIRNG